MGKRACSFLSFVMYVFALFNFCFSNKYYIIKKTQKNTAPSELQLSYDAFFVSFVRITVH